MYKEKNCQINVGNLKEKESNWMSVQAGVSSGPLLLLIYINDLTDNISSDMRLFPNDPSLFTNVNGITQTHDKLVKDFPTILMWVYQWKMVFNHYITNQEVIFSCPTKLNFYSMVH